VKTKIQKLLASQNMPAKLPCLIKITHEVYGIMFFANSDEDVKYNGDNYWASCFEVQPPAIEGGNIGNATLTISAVDQEWIQKIRKTQIPAQLEFVAAIEYDDEGVLSVEPLEDNNFTLRTANWTEISISWEMSFDERQSYILTSIKCTPQVTPGCA